MRFNTNKEKKQIIKISPDALPPVVKKKGRPKSKSDLPLLTLGEKKEIFLEAYRRNKGFVFRALKESRFTHIMYSKWLETDPNFVQKLKNIDEEVVEGVEFQLLKKIDDGDTQSILFYLRCRRPEKWNDKAGQQLNINITGTEFRLGSYLPDNEKVMLIEKIKEDSGFQE